MSAGRADYALISANDLVNDHALSFSRQPYLRQMFDSIQKASMPLTLLIGAGLSMNSGLPSWGELVNRLAASIQDKEMARLVASNEGDQIRRAEIALTLAHSLNKNAHTHELIRDALFPPSALVVPGPLAKSLARLVAVRAGTVRIITTNFDRIVEQALEEVLGTAVEAFGLSEKDQWRQHCEAGVISVLHVHGMVTQAVGKPEDTVRHPLVLTQSQFLTHGAAVRDVIADALDGAVGLFVGVSLTDPNVIAPLYQSAGSDPAYTVPDSSKGRKDLHRYSISVMTPVTGAADDLQQAAYVTASAHFIDRKLNVKPILLKSFSQVNQVVADMSLALRYPDLYKSRPSGGRPSLRYGNRYKSAISTAYGWLGLDRPPYVPVGDASAEITERLRAGLSPIRTYLRRVARGHGLSYPRGAEENFQLCLWLRRLDAVSHGPTYSLELIGSSTFQNREPWAMRREVPISSDSPYAAAQAVFDGLPITTNLDGSRNSGLWRGVIAVPITVGGFAVDGEESGQMLDQLTIGALTLDSTHYADGTDAEANEEMSRRLGVLSYLDENETDALLTKIYQAGAAVLLNGA
ncbi:SIR2 family protein [Mycobacterium sp. 236(2023)]|uniref:SIR2 family protein n=1 Tax=Mycobacterium sp. 236(2023) TaxID=3038163 RepID=UPI002414E7EE|nr:SIR2 family protein [Mycobacterium sp. 236(2023)]MDG4669370.1 SIR2 family protein [Mycobacterium sp. 236(2023)]